MGPQRNLTVIDDSWLSDANCAGVESSLFFPEGTHYSPEARAVCAGCEVKRRCLDASFELGARDGLWGGLDPIERKRLRRAELKAARNAR